MISRNKHSLLGKCFDMATCEVPAEVPSVKSIDKTNLSKKSRNPDEPKPRSRAYPGEARRFASSCKFTSFLANFLIWPNTNIFKMATGTKVGLYQNTQSASYLSLNLYSTIATSKLEFSNIQKEPWHRPPSLFFAQLAV